MKLTPLDHNTTACVADVGGKGAGLVALIQMGMPVPKGVALTTAAYEDQARRCGLDEKIFPSIEEEDWAAVEQAAQGVLQDCPLDQELVQLLLDSYRRMGSPAVAVRSSATLEDLEGASSAGQYETRLNVQGPEALLAAIRHCWASLWSRRALAYRHRRGMDQASARMAVIIQEMVPAEAAGVLFTQDPLAPGDNHIRVEAVPGLGEALVSGSMAGDVYRVDRTSLRESDAKHRSELLAPALLMELCAMALRIEEHFAAPQDIEFAVAQGAIHLLQARPMTALLQTPVDTIEPLGRPSLLDKMIKPFADERYVVAPKPLDNVVVNRLLGGHIYSIRETGAVISRQDEDEAMARLWRQAYRLPPVKRLWRMYLLGVPLMFRQLKTDRLAWWEQGHSQEMQALSGPQDLASLDDQALFARSDAILAAWEEHLNQRMSAAGGVHAEALLRLLVSLAVGRNKRDQVMSRLMAGIETPTMRLNKELWGLSRMARQDSGVLEDVRREALDRLEKTAEGRALLKAVQAFLDRHGHREGACWYLTSPTWRQDPSQVWRLLASLVDAEDRTRDSGQTRERQQEALALVEKRLRFVPGLRPAFHWLWRHLHRLNAFREQSHYDLTRPLDALQAMAREWGRRLLERNVLEREEDVAYLTYEEVRDWLCAGPPAMDAARALVERRRATYRLVNANWQAGWSGIPARGKILKGIAASPGVGRGKAGIIHGEHAFGRFQAGQVLVCPYTNPSWTPLFAMASAVVTETGGLSSHAAIVAREYGIPAVMGVPGATRTLKQGQEIVVDGNRGLVAR